MNRRWIHRRGVRGWELGSASLAILLLAIFLRFDNLSSQGFMHWDEGVYALEGQFLADTWHQLAAPSSDPNWAPGGRPPAFLRPFHSVLISLAMLARGTSAASALLVSATSGLLTVLLVLILGWRMFSPVTGVLAAAFLATMPLDVVYSRQILSEANGILVFTCSVLAYWLSRTSPTRRTTLLSLSGVLMGVSIVTNLRLYVMPAFFLACELSSWLLERRQRRIEFLRRLIVFAYSALATLLLTASALWWLRDYYRAAQISLGWPIVTYEDQLGYFWNMQHAFTRPFFGGLDPLFYPYVLWHFVGSGLVLCLALFLIFLVVRRRGSPPDILAAVWLLVPFLFFSLLTDKAPRFISPALPAISLAAARGLTETARLISTDLRPRLLAGLVPSILAAVIITSGLTASYKVAQQVSGYPPASAFAIAHGAKGVIAGQPLPVEFLTGQAIMTAAIPEDETRLINGYRLGYRYVIIDDHAYVNVESRALAEKIEHTVRPVAFFPDTLKDGPLFCLEYSESIKVDLKSMLKLYEQIRRTRGNSEVRVYDLGQYLLATGHSPP